MAPLTTLASRIRMKGGKKNKQNRRVKVPDDGKGEGCGLNPIQPAVRVGLEQRLWC